MLALTKRSAIATALMVGLATGMPLSIPAFADATASTTTMPGRTDSQLQHGDLVRLRSGGPLMTVADVRGDQINCFWTDENSQPNDATFPVQVLQKF